MAMAGEENSIKKVGGQEETRHFLKNLGFVPGARVTIIARISGNVIVSIKESRVAVSGEMASKIMI
jgi:ferrous iron transport protein A